MKGWIDLLQSQYNTFDIAALAKEQASLLAGLRAQLVQKSLEIDSCTWYAGIEDPALRQLRSERESLRSNIAKLEVAGRPEFSCPSNEIYRPSSSSTAG